MKKTIIALIAPPAAVLRHGSASYTAAPIGVFWLTAVFSLAYGLSGGKLHNLEGSQWFIVGLGLLLWLIAAAWARLVVSGIEDDLQHRPQSTQDHKITPTPDDEDPLKQVRGMR